MLVKRDQIIADLKTKVDAILEEQASDKEELKILKHKLTIFEDKTASDTHLNRNIVKLSNTWCNTDVINIWNEKLKR